MMKQSMGRCSVQLAFVHESGHLLEFLVVGADVEPVIVMPWPSAAAAAVDAAAAAAVVAVGASKWRRRQVHVQPPRYQATRQFVAW